MRTDKTSLGTKIYISQGLTVGFLLVLGAATLVSTASLERRLDESINGEARKLELCGRINAAVATVQSAQRGVVLGSLTGDTKQLETSHQLEQTASSALQSAIAELEPLLHTTAGRQQFTSLKQNFGEWTRQLPQFDNHIRSQQFDEATKMQAGIFTPLLEKMQKESAGLAEQQRGLMGQAASEASSQASFSRWFTLVMCLVAAVVAAGAFWVIRNANIGLRRIAGEIAEGSRQVASASQQVSSSSQALAQGSSEQAASLEETSASTEEINSMTQKNAENARGAAAETEKADHLLKETTQKLGHMIGSMKEINTSSEKISKIIRVIDEIAFQTNILALNAAVEAARAGEAGMGFAVVADEVRNLAQRCAQAAKDTSDLIEESIVRSNEGKVRLDEVAVCVGRVVENASAIKVLANEVHVGSKEQARGIEQIARAIGQMQQVTQSTAASAEEGASAGEEMSAQAASLQDAVHRLRDLVGGSAEAAQQQHAMAAAMPGRSSQAALKPRPAAGAQPARSDFPLDDDFKNF